MIRTLTPIISIVLGLLIFFLFTQPLFSDIGMLQSEASEYQEAVAKASDFNQRLNELISERNSLTAQNLERLEAAVPDDINTIKMLVDLEGVAQRNSMLFGNVSVSQQAPTISTATNGGGSGDGGNNTVTSNDFTETQMQFSVIGTYEEFRAFLRDIERNLALPEITRVSFDANDGQLQQYSIQLTFYSLNPMNR